MCGIVGIVPRESRDPAELRQLVQRMADALVHRGPDDEGFLVTPDIALGARRLQIIDIEHGRQPMSTEDGSLTLVYNGEVYNYPRLRAELGGDRAFRTTGDTEVVLRVLEAWGVEGIRRLEGMFAFAAWDSRERTLTLARDWLGQKQVYYAETEPGWIFASEIKALIATGLLRLRPDFEALSCYMSLRYLPADRTLFAGIHKLPAAHSMTVDASRRETQRLWTPSYEPKFQGSEAELLEALDWLLADVVGEHLMSEVPLGAFLSGGIDSSLIVAYAARQLKEPLTTFSVGVHETSQSELPWARRVAERYATDHHEHIVEPDLARMVPRMLASLEEPVDPFAAGVYIVSEVTSSKVTVALGGDGGDELFAGYDRYVGQQLAEVYAHLPGPLRRGLLRPLIRLVPETFGYKSLATKLRWLDRMSERDGVERYAESVAFLRFPHAMKAEIFTEELWRDLGRHESERLLATYFSDGSARSFVDRMLHADCMTRLMEHQLPILDRMSMVHSLEARSPFLDRRIAELAFSIPASWKLKSRRLKYVTRKLGERYLDRELIDRSKQGFGFPIGQWIRGELRELMTRSIRDSRLAAAGIFAQPTMARLLDEHLRGSIDHAYRLWMIYNLELWYRHFIDGEPVHALEDWIAGGHRRPVAARANVRALSRAAAGDPASGPGGGR